MPIIIPVGVPYSGNPANAVVLPTTPSPTPIPEIWNGLQCFFDMSWTGVWENPLHPADFPTVAWRNYYGYRLYDAADRLRWADSSGNVRNFAFRFAPIAGLNNAWPTVQTAGARLVNTKPALSTKTNGHVLRVTGDNLTANGALLTSAYTMVVVYKAEAGALGGIVGQGDTLAHDAAGAGTRFGFKSGSNDGVTIYQHRNDAGNRLEIARDTANGAPTLAIISGATDNSGNVLLKNSNSETSHAFSFAAGFAHLTSNFFTLGYQDSAAGNAKWRDIALFVRWNRVLTSAELTYLKSWLTTYYGPF